MSVFRNYQLCHCSLLGDRDGGRENANVREALLKQMCCVQITQTWTKKKTSNRWEFLGDFETRFRSVSMATSLQNWAKGEYIHSTSICWMWKMIQWNRFFPRPHTLRPVIAGTAWRMCWRAIAQAEVCKVVNKTTQVFPFTFFLLSTLHSLREGFTLYLVFFFRALHKRLLLFLFSFCQ